MWHVGCITGLSFGNKSKFFVRKRTDLVIIAKEPLTAAGA